MGLCSGEGFGGRRALRNVAPETQRELRNSGCSARGPQPGRRRFAVCKDDEGLEESGCKDLRSQSERRRVGPSLKKPGRSHHRFARATWARHEEMALG